jgi:hypothetical protein
MANILVSRDQENIIHAHQTAAAGKPLNQNIRALHPKTVGTLKTPFRLAKNDENLPVTIKGQKTVGKDGLSKLDKTSFATPLAPRNRPPLGAKTANAKAFQTPAPLTAKPGRTLQVLSANTRRSNKSKITIASSEPVQSDVLTKQPEADDEPDFGYAPPPPVPLPDPPIDFEEDPELIEEVRHGVCNPYNSPRDENGLSIRLKLEEEKWKKLDEERVQKSLENLDRGIFPTFEELNKLVDDMIAAGPKSKRVPLSRVDSTEAKSAAAALSEPQPRLPAVATRTTQASELKKRGLLYAAKRNPLDARQATTSMRTNHAALSKNTIGFPKAKKAASILPRTGTTTAPKPVKIDQKTIHPRDFRDLYGSPPVESDMWFRLKQFELLEEDLAKDNGDSEEDLFDTGFFPFDNSKLDDEDFQLPMPE